MHSAVPTCEDCDEPIQRYVSSFSENGIEEETLACDCKAVRIRYSPREARGGGEGAVPDSWPSN